MYWVYVLECSDKSWYTGFTADLKKRLSDHHSGNGARTTSLKKDWKLIYCEGYRNKLDAVGREKFLKSGSGKRYLNKQLANYLTS